MKQGANKMDINTILKLAEEGESAKKISKFTGIAEDVVKKFIPKISDDAEDINGSNTQDDFE